MGGSLRRDRQRSFETIRLSLKPISGRGQNVLEIRDMVCGYGRVTALHGISLEVKAGQLVALIGANGAGKSTTLRAISGLVGCRSGSMFFDGQDITRAK